MTKDDRSEIREMFSDIIGTHSEKMNGEFKLIRQELVTIKEQTIKTNGRVNALEEEAEKLRKADLEHSLKCPNVGRIIALEKSEFSRKAIIMFIIKALSVAVLIAGLVFGYLELKQ